MESAFRYFGGLPYCIVCDNASSLVRDHYAKDASARFTERFYQFCTYYNLKGIATAVRKPRSKGKVERAIRYVQGNALIGKSFDSLQSINQWLERWALTYSDGRVLDDYLKELRTPKERFLVEKPMMLELDGMPRFVRVREETRKVDAAGLIRVDGNAYQLAREFAQQEVQLLIDEFKIVVTRKARLIVELDKAGSVYKPLLQKEIAPFLRRVHECGFAVKLDTNGTFPDKLKALVGSGVIDFVAMDIKNAPSRYPETVGIAGFDTAPVEESVRILMEGKVDYEFRTTAVSPFHTPQDIEEIGRWLSGAPRYFLQTFVDSGNLVGEGCQPFSPEEMRELAQKARPWFKTVEIRGI